MIPAERVPGSLIKYLRKGIGFRLTILVVLILLPFVALLSYIFGQRYETRKRSALQHEIEVAQGVSLTFYAYLQGIHKQSLSVGHAIKILAPGNEEQVAELLMTSMGHSASVLNMNWVDPQGIVLSSSSLGKAGTDVSKMMYYRQVVAGHDLVLDDLAPRGAVSGRASVTEATAIRNFRGGLEGMIIAELDPTTWDLLVKTRTSPDAAVTLFDSHGMVVFHSSSAGPEKGRWRQNDPMLARVLQSRAPEAGTRTAPSGNNDETFLSALVPVPEVGWVAGASRSKRVAYADLRRGMLVDSLLLATVFALAFLLAYLLGRNIVAPLRRLENDARLMGAGKAVAVSDPYAPSEVASLRSTMLAMTADLTKRAHELQESEELLRAVFENVYDGVLIHDSEGRILEVNRQWLDMFNVAKDQVAGLTIADISANPPPQENMRALWREVLAGQATFFEWKARRPGDDSQMDVEVFICPIRLRGESLIMACVRDITERKRVAGELKEYRDQLEKKVAERTEELARALEAVRQETAQRLATVEELRRKEQLLIHQSRLAGMAEMMGNIAHQWRQPLNVLGLIVQELKISYQKGYFTEELLMDGAARAMKVIGHMSQTIEDFRNLLSPEKALGAFEAKEAIEKVLSLLQLRAELEVQAEDDCPMVGSRNEFSQVVINLIANAHDVFRERQVSDPKITIRLFREEGKSVVTIADNGGGIDEAIMDRIFDPYFTTKGPEQGTGLGLFMSKTIIEKSMRGRLSARNAGGGAEFRIEVPALIRDRENDG